MDMEQAWLLPAIPAVAFVVLALVRGYLPREGDWIAIGASIASFVLFLVVAIDLFDQLPAAGAALVGNTSGFDWVKIEEIDFLLRIGFRVDQLTIVMLAAVTFVGMLVQIYSVGYMKGEARYGWYLRRRCPSSSRRCCARAGRTTCCCSTSPGKASASALTC